MKNRFWTGALVLLLLSANPALAASARQDSSGLVVWLFLGFCALIIVAQLVPVVLMALGLVKGMTKGKELSTPAETVHPVSKT